MNFFKSIEIDAARWLTIRHNKFLVIFKLSYQTKVKIGQFSVEKNCNQDNYLFITNKTITAKSNITFSC